MNGSRPDTERLVSTGDMREVLRRSVITGTAIVIPLAVTLFVLVFVLDFVSGLLDPLIGFLLGTPGVSTELSVLYIKVLAVLTLLVLVVAIGFVTEFSSRGRRVGEGFDDVMESLPGLGSVYTSFNEMSELLLDSDTDSFREVVLVEYPNPGSYTVAFKTSETPEVIEAATDAGDMMTLFMPMAPNPVMGGFVIHVSKERVVEVDMTVEEGIRSIVTSGVAVGEGDAAAGLSEEEMRDLGADAHGPVTSKAADETPE